jgi:heterotetrameric sarcosine oxidase delta subunit
MRIPCPHCGERGSEEFYYLTAADRTRPAADASAEDWHEYVYLRDNPNGVHREHWQHLHGCRRWLTVTRHVHSHEIMAVEDAVRYRGRP